MPHKARQSTAQPITLSLPESTVLGTISAPQDTAMEVMVVTLCHSLFQLTVFVQALAQLPQTTRRNSSLATRTLIALEQLHLPLALATSTLPLTANAGTWPLIRVSVSHSTATSTWLLSSRPTKAGEPATTSRISATLLVREALFATK